MWRIVGTFMTGVMFLAYGLGTTAVHAEIAFEDPVEYPVEGQPGSLATADFDGINGPDLVTGTAAATVAFMLNNGDGTFRPDGAVAVPSGLPQVFAMDFDGINGPDVATGNFRTRNVSVLLNNGNATFAPPVTYPVGTLPSLVGRIAGADFDGVNGPDIAVHNTSFNNLDANSVSVLFNNGDGTFSAAVNYPLGILGPHDIAAADLDGLNGPDLAVSNRDDNTVSVFLNKGDGTFEPPLSFPAPGAPTRVIAADLDGIDGPDLATINFFDSVGILLNKGDGTFDPTVLHPVGGGGSSLAAADFDRDSDLDLVAASFESNNVSVLPNNGDGTFMPILSVPVGHTTEQVVAEDFDGVNGPALAVTDSGLALSNVSVLLNATSVLINDLVTLDDVDTAFNPTDSRAPAGVFTIAAMFTNISVTPIRYPFFQVTALTSGDVLLNADGGAGGVGATLTADVSDDQILSPGESFAADFDIGLQSLNSFTFIVDLLGQPVGSLIEGAVWPCVVQPPNFHDGNCYETSFLSGQGFLENTVFDLRTSPTGIHFDTTSPFVVDLSSSVGVTSADVTATFGDFVEPTQAETLHLEFAPGSFEAGDRLIFNVNIDYGPRGPGITFSAFMDDGREGRGLFVGEFTDPGNAGVIVEAR